MSPRAAHIHSSSCVYLCTCFLLHFWSSKQYIKRCMRTSEHQLGYIGRSPRQDCGSPILPVFDANFCSNQPPLPIWFSSDGLTFYSIRLDRLPQFSIANSGDVLPHCTMTAESTQGDNHDKAWEKAEKKFTQYVSNLFPPPSFCVCLFPKHDMTFLKSSVIAGSSLHGIWGLESHTG